MSNAVSEALRRQVAERAEFLCEYCLLGEEDGLFSFQVDHIISRKHEGPTELSNLAFACPICNRHKGSDLGTISRWTGKLTRFFNPRTDAWGANFYLSGARIEGLADIGEGTVRIFAFNDDYQITERASLMAIGRYPSVAALGRMRDT